MAPMLRLFRALVKSPRTTLLTTAGLLLACYGPTAANAARKARPEASIPLAEVDFGPFPPAYLQTGQTMFTLNFVDDRHLLLTHNTKGLLPRLKDEQPGDEDRNVAALLVELPSGKVIAQGTWRTRDHGRYLWALGNGRFLLRVRNHFSVIDPLRNLPSGEPFQQHELVGFKRRIALVDVSADGGLLTVETAPAPPKALIGGAASAAALAAASTSPPVLKVRTPSPSDDYILSFYRLFSVGQRGGPGLVAQNAGRVRSHQPAEIAMTPQGYLTIVQESSNVYDFDFHSYSGKKLELAPYDTTCLPHAMFTSATEFIAFGCRGGTAKNEMSGFNLQGEEPWVSVLGVGQTATFLMSAPQAGRFALSLTQTMPAAVLGVAEDSATQPEEQVEVVQHHDGRVLLNVSAAPMQLAGQNFDLSADGLHFAVVQRDGINVYQLPGLSGQDQRALQLASRSLTEPASGPVRLAALTVQEESGPNPDQADDATSAGPAGNGVADSPEAARGNTPAESNPTAASNAGATATQPGIATAADSDSDSDSEGRGVAADPRSRSRTIQNGDIQSEGHRKPPTLYDDQHPKPADAPNL